jgi:hypothetical protein
MVERNQRIAADLQAALRDGTDPLHVAMVFVCLILFYSRVRPLGCGCAIVARACVGGGS